MAGTYQPLDLHFIDYSHIAHPAARSSVRIQPTTIATTKQETLRKISFGHGLSIQPPAQAISPKRSKLISSSVVDSCLASLPRSERSKGESPAEISYQPADATVRDSDGGPNWDHGLYATSIPPKMACTGYELFRVENDFDILDLSALTSFHIGRITTATLHTSPSLLNGILKYRQWSYFSYIPSRFGHFTYLDAAARCVASRVRNWMEGEVSVNATTVRLYTRALRSLQTAINDPTLRLRSETLCATELLSIYELLNNPENPAWSQHAAGAKSLLRLRGPQRFKTSFEMALFLAQIGPICTEALVENLRSFLDEPGWHMVLQSAVREHPLTESPFSDRGAAVIELWFHMVNLPNLWYDIQFAVCSSDFTAASKIEELRDRVIALNEKISRWRGKYEPLLRSIPELTFSDCKEEKRFETLGISLSCATILKRLAVAVNPLGPFALKDEMEAENLARDSIELEKMATVYNPRAALFMSFKKKAAQAVLDTKDDWRVSSVVDARVGADGLIATWVLERWCKMKGRKI